MTEQLFSILWGQLMDTTKTRKWDVYYTTAVTVTAGDRTQLISLSLIYHFMYYTLSGRILRFWRGPGNNSMTTMPEMVRYFGLRGDRVWTGRENSVHFQLPIFTKITSSYDNTSSSTHFHDCETGMKPVIVLVSTKSIWSCADSWKIIVCESSSSWKSHFDVVASSSLINHR